MFLGELTSKSGTFVPSRGTFMTLTGIFVIRKGTFAANFSTTPEIAPVSGCADIVSLRIAIQKWCLI
jgi:hypothetical protein